MDPRKMKEWYLLCFQKLLKTHLRYLYKYPLIVSLLQCEFFLTRAIQA